MTSGSSKPRYEAILRGSGDDPGAALSAARCSLAEPFEIDCPIEGCAHPIAIGSKALCSMTPGEIDESIKELSQLLAAMTEK